MKVSCLTAAVMGVACLAAASAAAASALDLQSEVGGIEGVEAASGAAQRVLAKDDTMMYNIRHAERRQLKGDGKGKKPTKKPTKKTGTKKPTKKPTKKRTKKPTKKPRPAPDAAAKNQFDLGPQFKKIEKFRCPGNNYISEVSGTANKVLNSVTSFKCMPSKKKVKVSVGAPKKGTKYTVKSASGFRSFKGGFSANGEYASSITFYKDRLFDMEAKPTLGSQQKDGTALSPWLCDQGTRLTGLRLKGNTGGVVGFGTICADVTEN